MFNQKLLILFLFYIIFQLLIYSPLFKKFRNNSTDQISNLQRGNQVKIFSPLNKTIVQVRLGRIEKKKDCIVYRVFYDGIEVVTWSPFYVGFATAPPYFRYPEDFEVNFEKDDEIYFDEIPYSFVEPQLLCNFDLVSSSLSSNYEKSRKSLAGENEKVSNNYHEVSLNFQNPASGINIKLTSRVFDEGMAFQFNLDPHLRLSYVPKVDSLVIGTVQRFSSGFIHIDRGTEKGFETRNMDTKASTQGDG